jgi:hypothetical protein
LRREVSLSYIELATITVPHNVLRVGDRCGPTETLSEGFSDKCSRPDMVTAGTSVYLLQQLVALISGNAPHEYVGRPTLVELAVDDDESFRAAGDVPGFCLVGRELPFDQPLEDGETPIGIFKVLLWRLVNCHDLESLLFRWLVAIFSYVLLVLIAREHAVWNRAATGCCFLKHVGRFIVITQHVVQLEDVEFALQISNSLAISCDLWVNAILVFHDLSHDQF